jgi:signal transduction histidine kinase
MPEIPEEITAADYDQGSSPVEAMAIPVVPATPANPLAAAGIELTEQTAPAAPVSSQADLRPGAANDAVAAGASALSRRLSELEELNERLREQDRVKAGFISMVVHDIRSPLTVIMGTLDLLNEDLVSGAPLDHQHYQYLFRESLRNCQEIDRLIEDMLELSRMRENRLRLNFELTSCAEVIEEALSVAAGAARQAGVTLEREIQPQLPQVFVDRKQMHRALMNLISNAIKFTPRGGQVTLRARILEERRQDAACDYVLLSVADTGEGLAADETPYIFDPYWQSPNGLRKKGAGLGLAIVKRISVAHGGNVSVRSAPGKGSAFTIMIPVRDSAPEQMIDLAE